MLKVVALGFNPFNRCRAEARAEEARRLNKHLEENQFQRNRAAKLRRLAEEQAEEDRYLIGWQIMKGFADRSFF